MPRRLLLTGYLVAALALGVTALLTGVSFQRDSEAPRYTIELDAATGLTEGGDLKLAGVRAGRIEEIDLDLRTRRALVRVVLTSPGFDRFQSDAYCRVRPQSLIGEYYLDCQPGRSSRRLARSFLPVAQTGGSIGLDLLNTITRKPERERLRILLGELGAGVAARGPELDQAIRRAVPALRETNELLALLADENRTITRLIEDADVALAPADRRREELARFVKETAEASDVSADRRAELAEQFRVLPAFLREAVPTMRALGDSADAQAGTIDELGRGAQRLRALFAGTGDFTASAVPATRGLAATARAGRPVVPLARPVVRELDEALVKAPETFGNLAVVLEHLDSRDNAVEDDPLSPGGKGFTGLEAFLQYARNQSLAINVFDSSGYKLKANNLSSPCGTYGNAEVAKAEPECRSWLGPTQPAINAPDPSPPPPAAQASAARRADDRSVLTKALSATPAPGAGARSGDGTEPLLDLLLR